MVESGEGAAMDGDEYRRCPRCGDEKPAVSFLDWQGQAVCLDCHAKLFGGELDEYAERLHQRYGTPKPAPAPNTPRRRRSRPKD
jgi:hypothetical protein